MAVNAEGAEVVVGNWYLSYRRYVVLRGDHGTQGDNHALGVQRSLKDTGKKDDADWTWGTEEVGGKAADNSLLLICHGYPIDHTESAPIKVPQWYIEDKDLQRKSWDLYIGSDIPSTPVVSPSAASKASPHIIPPRKESTTSPVGERPSSLNKRKADSEQPEAHHLKKVKVAAPLHTSAVASPSVTKATSYPTKNPASPALTSELPSKALSERPSPVSSERPSMALQELIGKIATDPFRKTHIYQEKHQEALRLARKQRESTKARIGVLQGLLDSEVEDLREQHEQVQLLKQSSAMSMTANIVSRSISKVTKAGMDSLSAHLVAITNDYVDKHTDPSNLPQDRHPTPGYEMAAKAPESQQPTVPQVEEEEPTPAFNFSLEDEDE